MSELSQSEFDYLMNQEKRFEDESTILLGPAPLQWSKKIQSTSTKDTFSLDFYRGTFRLEKYTYNHRFKQTTVLMRFDSYGEHSNPDGERISGHHVHIYKEGFGDKFAYPASNYGIESSDTIEVVMQKILVYCNIKIIPPIEIPMN